MSYNVSYALDGQMFGLSLHERDVVHYCGMAFVKLVMIVFFFIPWLAIRLVLRKRSVSWRVR